MRAFRIGYILTVSFILVLMVVTLTFGFYPPPQGPKAPAYPASYTSGTYNPDGSYNDTAYRQQQQQYQDQQKQYEEQQKGFLQEKIIPYARNVFVTWIVTLVAFEIVGLILVKYISEVVGATFAFSGVWAVLFGPLGGLLWFVNSLVSSFGRRAEQDFSAEPIMQAIGITCLIGVIILSLLGLAFYNHLAPKPLKTA